MQFNNLHFYISPQFKAQFSCELLESYCEVEGIHFVKDLDEKPSSSFYSVHFVKQQEIKRLKNKKQIFITNIAESGNEEDYSINLDSTYDLQELFEELKKIENQIKINNLLRQSHEAFEKNKSSNFDPCNEELVGFFKKIIELEFKLLKIQNIKELNSHLQELTEQLGTFEQIEILKLEELALSDDHKILCFRIIDNEHCLIIEQKKNDVIQWAKIEILINSITKYYNNHEIGLVKDSGETNILKKVFSHLDYPLAMITEHGDLLVYNEKFANLEISPKGCLKIQDTEFIEMDDEFYRLKRVPVKLSDTNAFYFIFFTEEEKFKEQFKDQTNRSENANKSVDELGIISSSIAHELNNPFAGILAALTLLSLEEWPLDVKNDLIDMQNSARRCKDLVEIFLGFSRYSPTHSHLMNLESSFHQAINLLRFRMMESNVRLEFQYTVSLEKFNAQINNSVCAMIFYLIFSEMMTSFAHHKLVTAKDLPALSGTVVEFSNQFVIRLDEMFEFEQNIASSKLIHYLLKFEKLKINFSKQEMRIAYQL